MNVIVVGLGAIGGLIAARLAAAGHQVQALVRGATLAAVREHGLRSVDASGEITSQPVFVSDNVAALADRAPEPDLVVLALKAPALAQAADGVSPLLQHGAAVLPAMNGVPWWFLMTPPDSDPRPLASIDPDGRIGEKIPLAQVLGCVLHLTSSCPQPGQVRHGFGNRLVIGEPAGGRSSRARRVAEALGQAGFETEVSENVRSEIWYKLWGNMTMNPVSALTGATSDHILQDSLVREFMGRAMGEAAAIGERIGCPIAQTPDQRMALTAKLGAFKTSMLQDAEAGKVLEIDALVTAVHEIAKRVGVPTPHIGALLGLTRLMARTRGLYSPGAP